MHYFIKRCVILGALAISMHGFSSQLQPASDEEAFLIRRIAEFWKDGDYGIVKSQINDFIKKYPASPLKDYLQGILADLFLQETQYHEALNLYSSIHDKDVYERILLNKLQCYYELNQYDSLVKEGEKHLQATSNKFGERQQEYTFIMAEGYFRQALASNDSALVSSLIAKAQPLYEQLVGSEYEEVSLFSLAEIYRLSHQDGKGVELYLKLADKHLGKREALLFNAAILEANINKTSAIELFDRVIGLNGPKAGEASFNRLLLYFQTEQYENVINQHRVVYPYVPEQQMSSYYFIVGKSFYLLQDYENATTPLEKFILDQKESSDQYRDALLLQMTCAKHIGNEPLFAKTLARFENFYPSDQELLKARFMHAMLLKKEKMTAKAEETLKSILPESTRFEDPESLWYEYAIIAHENGKYDISYNTLQAFLKNYANSERTQSAWRYFLSSCLHLSKGKSEAISYSREAFLHDLQKVLTSNAGLNDDETREYTLLYTQLTYELGYYNDCLEHATRYISQHPDHESLGEAHLLVALSLGKLNADPEKFCVHLEKALELNPEEYNTSAIHLQLYNAYITRAQAQSADPALLEHAALHLYTALQDSTQPIKIENQLWLASYYYKLCKNYLDAHWTHTPGDKEQISTYLDRSCELYDRAFKVDRINLKNTQQANLYLEAEVLKYAEVTGLKGDYQKKIVILEDLISEQNSHADWNWQFSRQAFFELASAYEHLNDLENALETYQFINDYPKNATPITILSSLKSAKIKFELIDKKNRNEKNPEVVAILNQLKDIQIRKHAFSEPLHIEAGLEYTKIRTALSPENMKDSRYLFFLARVKEDFTSTEDKLTQEYLTALKKNPFQENIYTAYMKFIDAEILRIQAKQLLNDNKKEEAMQRKRDAIALLSEIENSKAPTPYLQGEVAKSMKLLR